MTPNENYSLKKGWKLDPGEVVIIRPKKGLETRPRRRNENYSLKKGWKLDPGLGMRTTP